LRFVGIGLPTPPSLGEIRVHTPCIRPVRDGSHRPFWSVMIPTYDSGDYLRRTLESVLCQDPGPDEMQIEVVDGCSTKDDPERITKELGNGRVAFYRLPANKGGPHTFNHCIERSRGHWVHILHGDDMVGPDFYETYATTIRAHPQAQVVIGQALTIDEDDRCIGLFGVVPPIGGGVLEDFAERQASRQLALFPAVVVRRQAYQEVGGFCTLFEHVADWDMWFRLGKVGSVVSIPRPSALFRLHSRSETTRLMISASNVRESYFVISANLARLSGLGRAGSDNGWRSRLATAADIAAWELDARKCLEGRYNQARWAWMLEPNMRRLMMLLKSWLKHKLSRTQGG
jgi:GT2 family glycosyltransferase